jgi:hypothetical protein
MSLTKRQEKMLNQIVTLVEKFRAEAAKQPVNGGTSGRVRRTAAQAEKMRKEILAARAKGVAAAKLAEKYGVSNAYIYMIKE